MTRGFKSVWGEKPSTRRAPSATTAGTDAESGNDGGGEDGGIGQALHALDAMFKRGLIPEEEYRRRRAQIKAGKVSPDD
jgi:hypothetical protein